jgi:hypothetical protein
MLDSRGGLSTQTANLACSMCRALRQRGHLGHDHPEPTAMLPRPRRLHCCVERPQIGLKRDAVDHSNDLGNAAYGSLDGLHLLGKLRHLVVYASCVVVGSR